MSLANEPCPHGILRPRPDPPVRIKKAEQDNIKCSKDRKELASVQTRILEIKKLVMEVTKRRERDAESINDLMRELGIPPSLLRPGLIREAELNAETARQQYEEYKGATTETRAYKGRKEGEKTEQAEETKAGSSAGADGASTKGKTEKMTKQARK